MRCTTATRMCCPSPSFWKIPACHSRGCGVTGLTLYCFGVGAALMVCMETCVKFPFPYNLRAVLKEGWSPALAACPMPVRSLYFLLLFGSCNSNFVLYKCEFIWKISKAPCSFSNLLRLGVSLYDSLLKWPQICVLTTHSCIKYSSQWWNACLGLA